MAYPPGPPPNQPGAPPPGYPPQGYGPPPPGYPPPGYPPPGYYPPPPKDNTARTVLIVLGCIFGGLVVIGGIVAAVAIAGVRRYLDNSKRAEATSNISRISTSIQGCYVLGTADESGNHGHVLPPSTKKVPASLSDVAGKKYMSDTSDWAQPAFECGHFSLYSPQFFQYQWVKKSDTTGTVTAVADFDGDGKVDASFARDLDCDEDGGCKLSPIEEKDH